MISTVVVRGRHRDRGGLDRRSIYGDERRQRASAVEDVGEMVRPALGEVQEDEDRGGEILWQVFGDRGESLDAARGCADDDDLSPRLPRGFFGVHDRVFRQLVRSKRWFRRLSTFRAIRSPAARSKCTPSPARICTSRPESFSTNCA